MATNVSFPSEGYKLSRRSKGRSSGAGMLVGVRVHSMKKFLSTRRVVIVIVGNIVIVRNGCATVQHEYSWRGNKNFCGNQNFLLLWFNPSFVEYSPNFGIFPHLGIIAAFVFWIANT